VLLLPQELDLLLLLNPIPHHKLELLHLHELLPELEPTLRPLHLTAVTEFRSPLNNAKEDFAAHTDADSTRPTDLADSDLQELPKLVSRKEDAMDSEFADQLSSNKTPRRNVSKPMEQRENATSPLEIASKFFLSFHRSRFRLDPSI